LLLQKAFLDLSIDRVQPLLGVFGFFAVSFDLRLQLRNTILGRTKLVRKSLRPLDRMSAVLLGRIGSFA
jgi:hypothetical protein